jgi:hypothetical protein
MHFLSKSYFLDESDPSNNENYRKGQAPLFMDLLGPSMLFINGVQI